MLHRLFFIEEKGNSDFDTKSSLIVFLNKNPILLLHFKILSVHFEVALFYRTPAADLP